MAVLAAVLTGSSWDKPVQQASQCACAASAVDATLPEPVQQETMAFIKTVPMQHVESHYVHSDGKASVRHAFASVPYQSHDSPAVTHEVQPTTMHLQPFAQMLRMSSDSSDAG